MAGFNLHNNLNLNHKRNNYSYDGLNYEVHEETKELKLTTQLPKHYPFQKLAQGIYLEGYIYNAKASAVGQQVEAYLNDNEYERIADLIGDLDGEFLFLFISNKGKVFLINDRWGHLPIYFWNRGDHFIVSRNISFITKGVDLQYDQMSMAMMLLMGTTLGNETLWKDVHRIAPHSICEMELSTGKLNERTFYSFGQFEGNRSIDAIAAELKSEVDKSMENRLKQLKNPALSLSGGLDSRLAAASICSIDKNIPFITHKRPSGIDDPDCEAAQVITSRLNINKHHTIVDLQEDNFEDIIHLIEIKQGLNSASMGHVLPFHKYFSDRDWSCISDYGGGGKFFRKLYPHSSIKSDQELIDYILKFHALDHPKKVAEICGLRAKEIIEHIHKHIQSYPNENTSDKYAYFMFREILINWAYEADRQRNYSWVTVPFYAPGVVELCFSVPQESKKGGKLFKKLFDLYPGNLGNIENPNWKVSLENQRAVNKLFKRQGLKANLPLQFVLNRKKGQLNNFPFKKELSENLKQNNFFPNKTLPERANHNFYWQYLTLLLLTNRVGNY